MFGGSKPAFGQAATTSAFGFNNTASASPFAQSSFGKPQASGFGQAPAFGQQNTSLFGGATQSTGLFGSANPAPAFGTNAATTQSGFGGFGQQQQQPTTSLFGTPQTNPNTSLFGTAANTSFGGTAKPTPFGFGAPQPTSLFGTTNTTAQPATGGFFGQTQPGSMFGTTAPAFGGQQNTASGTALAKYQASLGTDTLMKNGGSNQVNTKQHCITAMKEYENKSLEELRMEDYQENRKGPQTGQSNSGLFSTAPNTGGIFSTQMPQQQQQSSGIFGQNDNKNLFGNQNNLNFGQANPGFGATQNTSLFSKPFAGPLTAATTSSFGAFNNTTTTANPFGPKPFGATQTTGSIFGQPATSTAPAFGQPNVGGGFFNANNTQQQQPNTLFGTTENKPAFGLGGTQTSNAGFGTFGTNTNTNTQNNSPFGMNKPASSFAFGAATTQAAPMGQFGSFGQNTGGSLFNTSFNSKPAAPAFGTFTSQANAPLLGTSGGLQMGTSQQSFFGSNANKPNSLFGNAPGQTTSLFGNNTFGGGLNNFGNNMGGNPTMGGTTSQTTVPIHQQIFALTTSPYGENPIFKDFKASGATEESLKVTNPATQKAILESTSNQFKVSPKVGNALRVKPVGELITKKSLFEGLEEHDSSVEECFNLAPNAKRLIINKKALTTNRNQFNSSSQESQIIQSQENTILTSNNNVYSETTLSSNKNKSIEDCRSENLNTARQTENEYTNRRESWLSSNALDKLKQNNRLSEKLSLDSTINEILSDSVKHNNNRSTEVTSSVNSIENVVKLGIHKNSEPTQTRFALSNDSLFSNSRSLINESVQDLLVGNIEPHPTGIVSTRPGYFTIPSLDDLLSYIKEDGSCVVPSFTIGREGYGNVYFNEPIDVSGLNLDEIVFFRNKEVIIYPDDANKPPEGQALNRKAQITLDQVWPHDKTIHEPIKDPIQLAAMDYESKLRRVCEKHDTRFMEYRPETGSWVFRVNHFSKYGLSDTDEEDNVPVDPKKAKLNLTEKVIGTISKDLINKNINKVPAKLSDNLESDLQNKNYEIDCETSMTFNYDKVDRSRGMFLPTSPTRELALDLGTDSHKLQLMKASFFNDDEYDGKSTISDYIAGRDSPDQIVPTKSLILTKRSSDTNSEIAKQSDFVGIDTISLDSAMSMAAQKEIQTYRRPEIEKPRNITVKPKRVQTDLTRQILPANESIFKILDGNCAADLKFMQGRKFKVGCGFRNSLVILTTEMNSELNQNIKNIDDIMNFSKYFPSRQLNDNSGLMLKHIAISSRHNDFVKTIVTHLEIELAYTIRDESGNCPLLKSGGGTTAIEDHFDEASNLKNVGETEEIALTVWSLLKALWGEREELESLEPSNHFAIMCRRDLFSKWLEELINNFNNRNETGKKQSYLKELLELLMSHKVLDACELAFRNDDINLSLLLSQISGGPSIRQLMNHQLSSWQEVEADKFISTERLKSYMLLAGVPVLASAHGPINIFDDLNWITCLAIHTWYLSSPTSSLTDILLLYEESFQSEEFNSKPPSPPYLSKYFVNTSKSQDLRFHLLKLFSKKSHPMEPLLNPATYSSDPMDYRLSWLMLQCLESLGYHHCSELSESQIHVSFAAQLERYGLWHWSIFVLLHIKDHTRREICVQEILYKYITLSDDLDYVNKERFTIENLKISKEWIFWAKAVKAGSVYQYHEQAKYLLKAKQWSMAHEIIMQHIVPDAIVNDNINYAKNLLEEFEDRRKISNWINQGQMILDYIEINEKFETLKTVSESDLETYWEALKPQLAELCSRINLFPCPTAKHRLCQSEISQKLAHLVRGILLTSDVNPCLVIKVALEKLPLPQEYAQQELRVLLDTYFADIERQMES